MRMANSLGFCLLLFSFVVGMAAAVKSGCPQINGTCLCDGDRAVLRVAYVVLGGGPSIFTSPWYAVTELAFREIEANTSFLPSVRLQPVYSFYDKDERMPVFQAVTKVTATSGLVALFGATSSLASEIMQLVASAGNFPQVSSTATSSALSDKYQFPTFMRTTISSLTQLKACVQLLRHYNWNEVIVVSDTSDLSLLQLQEFLNLAQDSSGGQPLTASLQIIIDNGRNATELARQMLESDVYYAVVFAAIPHFTRLFSNMIYQDLIHQNATGSARLARMNFFCFQATYIFSEAPAVLGPLLGPVFASYGMHPNVTVDQFYYYANGLMGLNIPLGNNERNTQYETFARNYNRTEFPGIIPTVMTTSIQLTVDAVYTIAHGLERVLANATAYNKTVCETFYSPSWDGRQLYYAMTNASFLGMSGDVSFLANGDRVGELSIVSLNSTFDATSGLLKRSTVVVTKSWSAKNGTFTDLAPIPWRDGSVSPPSPPPLHRRRLPVVTSEGDGGQANVKVWVPPVVIGIMGLLALNAAWMLRSKRQKKKVWRVDMGAIEWGPIKALDSGTSISDAVYHGVDVGVRRVPLSRTLMAGCREIFCDDGVRSGSVVVRSAFRTIDKDQGVVKVRAPKPYFDDDEVHVNLCVEPGGSSGGEAIGEDPGGSLTGRRGRASVGGTAVDTPRAALREESSLNGMHHKDRGGVRDSISLKDASIARGSESPLPRERKKALLAGTELLLRRTMDMHHPNLERVIGGGFTKGAIYILLERLTGGSLHAVMQNKTLDNDAGVMVGMLLDAASALKYLHSQRPPIVHGDLNPKSLFLDDNMSLKLSVVSPFRLLNSSLGRGVVPVTLEYAAPEVLAGRPSTPASDVFSFGMMLWECFARTDIYAELPLEMIVEGVVVGTVRPKPVPTMPVDLEGLMYECLSPWPHRRPTFGEIHARLLAAFQAKGGMQRFSALQSRLEAQEALIDKIMPPHVAAALHRGETVPPERHDSVTIMFSDIVGFTQHSAQLLPIEVMQMLDRLYTQFDSLTTRHGLFKVETIGDAYMVVGNLHPKADDHTARIVRFALDAIQVANTIPVKLDDLSMGTIHIRTGVHTGPVVASVVGTLNPRYCLFGDTVNMTSRIETSSQPDCVHLSQAAAAALAKQDPSLRTVKRGKVLLKGKGEMVTYWLESCVGQLPENVRAEMLTAGLGVDPSDTKDSEGGEGSSRDETKQAPGSRSGKHSTDLVINMRM